MSNRAILTTAREAGNRTVKALDIANVLFEAGISFKAAAKVPVNLGPFWPAVVAKTGRKVDEGKEPLSIETKREALYYLAAMEIASKGAREVIGRKLRRVK